MREEGWESEGGMREKGRRDGSVREEREGGE